MLSTQQTPQPHTAPKVKDTGTQSLRPLSDFLSKPVQNLINDRQTKDRPEHVRSRVRPSKLGPALICIDGKETVAAAFKLLKEHEILALPVYRTDESGHKHFHSIVSVMDLINATLLDPAFDYIALSTVEEVGGSDIDGLLRSWLNDNTDVFNKRTVEDAIGMTPESAKAGNVMIKTSDELRKLLDALMSGLHRVLVYDEQHEGDENWYTIVSQTDLLWYFHVNREQLPPDLFTTTAEHIMEAAALNVLDPYQMYDLDFKRAGPILVPFDVPAIVAANVMRLFNTSCVGVMNERNQLVGNLSGADFRGFNPKALQKMLDPVLTYIKVDPKGRSPVVSPQTTMNDCVETMLNEKVHRVWVCNEDMVPKGLVTMSDCLVVFQNPGQLAGLEE